MGFFHNLLLNGKNDMGNKNHAFLTHRQNPGFFCRWIDVKRTIAVLCVILTGGCSSLGLLVGNEDPVSKKANQYKYLDLAKTDGSNWKKLNPKQVTNRTNDHVPENEISDVVFQSKKTASIISLNSSCRNNRTNREKTLSELTNLLLLGIDQIKERNERTFKVGQIQALQTTVLGQMDQMPRKLRTVVLKTTGCIYDLMYFASPKNFHAESADFDRFVASIKIER